MERSCFGSSSTYSGALSSSGALWTRTSLRVAAENTLSVCRKKRTEKLTYWKERGDRLILVLAVGHLTMIAATIYIVTSDDWLKGYRNPRKTVVNRIIVSELFNFFVWFVKFAPLFLALYPIHRAQWYQGGELVDYLLCRRSCSAYKSSQKYRDKTFPRCVNPETKRLQGTLFSNLRKEHGGNFITLSTIRRGQVPAPDQKGDADGVELAGVSCRMLDDEVDGTTTSKQPHHAPQETHDL